jgi:anhydro-N-acetylmuramic acid kinase
MNPNRYYIGLMSGTSLDGVDGVLVELPERISAAQPMRLVSSAYMPFDAELRQQALDLQQSGVDEIHREALLANAISRSYAQCVQALRNQHPALSITAIGAHGQTIRHRPELGYTRQAINPALLAELAQIDVIADLRGRDIAAGGQGAPLVPAFHQAIFAAPDETRVVVNIGGISNISVLHANGDVIGFDTGSGNVLMDAWIAKHHGKTYDENGDWAIQGCVHDALLASLLSEPFLQQDAPKSTGRDLFHMAWLNQHLQAFDDVSPVDVQATLTTFTAISIADAIARYAPHVAGVYVCGGGAYNSHLMRQLTTALHDRACDVTVFSTDLLGVSPNHVEALAFAWLAQRFTQRLSGNLHAVTGAQGLRILGALYPA